MGIFDGIIGSAISGAFGAFGQQQTNEANAAAAQQTSAFNAEEAAKNRAFQQMSADQNKTFQQSMWQSSANWENEMSSSAYQRAVTDMKLAGLNPMLAYSQGGASSPSVSTPSGSTAGGSQASGVTPNYVNPVLAGAQAASMGASTALSVAQTSTEKERPDYVREQTRDVKSQADFNEKRADSALRIIQAQIELPNEQVNQLRETRDAVIAELRSRGKLQDAEAVQAGVRSKLLELDTPQAKALADYWSSAWGKASPFGRDVGGAFDSAVGAVRGGAAASSAKSYGQDVRNRGFYYGNH